MKKKPFPILIIIFTSWIISIYSAVPGFGLQYSAPTSKDTTALQDGPYVFWIGDRAVVRSFVNDELTVA